MKGVRAADRDDIDLGIATHVFHRCRGLGAATLRDIAGHSRVDVHDPGDAKDVTELRKGRQVDGLCRQTAADDPNA